MSNRLPILAAEIQTAHKEVVPSSGKDFNDEWIARHP
jgi:hypothetical protein